MIPPLEYIFFVFCLFAFTCIYGFFKSDFYKFNFAGSQLYRTIDNVSITFRFSISVAIALTSLLSSLFQKEISYTLSPE